MYPEPPGRRQPTRPFNPPDRLPPQCAGGREQIGPQTASIEIFRIDSDVLKLVPPGSRTLVLDLQETTAAPVNSDHRPQARVVWGSAKGENIACIDLIKGANLCLEDATAITVQASIMGYNFDASFSWYNVAPTASPVYWVVCSLGHSGEGKATANTLTDLRRTIAGGAQAIVPIPKYAQRVALHHSGDPFAAIPQDVEIGFVQWQAVGIPPRTQSGLRDTPIDIPSGSDGVLLTNRSAANVDTQLVFHLAI